MVVKRFFINISMLFFGALLLQAKNIIARDMGVNKGDVPANIAIQIGRASCRERV